MLRPLVLVLALGVPSLTAQASPYLTLDDWASPIVEHLIRSGVIDDPSPLSRPLTQGAILRAIAQADTTNLPAAVRGTLRMLRERLDAPSEAPRYHLDLYLEGAAGTQDLRDPVRTAGDRWVGGRGGMVMRATMGPLVVSAVPYIDTHLPDDPEWPGDTAFVDIPGRFTDVYLGVQTRYVDVTFGAVGRNWGMPELDGLLVSNGPYTYDHLALRLGSERLRVESVLTQLDVYPSALGPSINRFFVAHRVSFRPIRALQFAIGTGVVWRGVGAGWDTHYLNPFKLPRVTAVDETVPDSANTAYLGDMRVELPGDVVAIAQFLMDDWDVSPSDQALPNRFAGSLGLEAPLGAAASLRLFYTGVASVTYRTQQGPDFGFLRNGVGIARNHSDYTQATAAVSVMPTANLLLTPELTWLRQGESDLTDPFPPFPAPDYPFLFVGVVENTWRLAATGRFTLPEDLDVAGHAGVNHTRNAGHVPGATDTEFVAGMTIRWRFVSGDWR